MYKIALMMAAIPAALLTTTSASATVTVGETVSILPSGFDLDSIKSFWLNKDLGQLIIKMNGKPYIISLDGHVPATDPNRTPVPSALAVAEPMTWALMLTGLGVVGWTLRRRKALVQAHVAFA